VDEEGSEVNNVVWAWVDTFLHVKRRTGGIRRHTDVARLIMVGEWDDLELEGCHITWRIHGWASENYNATQRVLDS
jgi:hypothetical protein